MSLSASYAAPIIVMSNVNNAKGISDNTLSRYLSSPLNLDVPALARTRPFNPVVNRHLDVCACRRGMLPRERQTDTQKIKE